MRDFQVKYVKILSIRYFYLRVQKISISEYLFPELYLPKNHSRIKAVDIKPTVSSIPKASYFFGKMVCFTGRLYNYYRYEAMLKVVNLGGIPVDRFKNDVDIVIVGESKTDTVKLKKAKNKAIILLDEIEFCRLINKNRLEDKYAS